MALTVAQTADAGAPQAGITLDGLSSSVPCNAVITTSWDGGASWQSVRGGNLTGVLGSTFVRDYIPALNTSIQYKATLSATSPANAVTDPYATNAGEWLSYKGYGGAGAGTFAVNQSSTGPDGSSTTIARKTWTTSPTLWGDQGIEVRADTSGTQWPIVTSDGRTFSAWVYAASGSIKRFAIKIRWYNGTTLVGETQSAPAMGANAWLQLSITLPTTLPYPTATSFLLALDVIQSGTSWTGTANASTSIEVLAATRTNLCTNPSVEVDTTGWTYYAGAGGTANPTREISGGYSGTSFYRMTWTAASTGYGAMWAPQITAAGSTTYTCSMWVRCSAASTVSLVAQCYNGATATGITTGAPVACAANTWTRLSVTVTTASTDTAVRPYANMPPQALNATFDGDAVLIEQTATLGNYFDGSTGVTFWAVNEWMGATWAMIAPSGYTFPGYPPATMTSSSLTINSSTAWLQDPLNPRSAVALYSTMLNGQVQMTIRSLAGGVWGQHVDTAPVIGAALAVASISQRQKIAALPLSLIYNVAQEGGHLHTLMMTSGQLVLRGLPVSGLLDPVAHCSAGDANETRYGAGTISEWTLTARQVRPVSMKVVVPWWTYDQVKALVQSQISSSATYAQVESAQPAGKTYTQWLANPGVAS